MGSFGSSGFEEESAFHTGRCPELFESAFWTHGKILKGLYNRMSIGTYRLPAGCPILLYPDPTAGLLNGRCVLSCL